MCVIDLLKLFFVSLFYENNHYVTFDHFLGFFLCCLRIAYQSCPVDIGLLGPNCIIKKKRSGEQNVELQLIVKRMFDS